MLFRRIRAFEQRRRRDIFVEPNPNQIKVLANGHQRSGIFSAASVLTSQNNIVAVCKDRLVRKLAPP